jgi:hypothetical protein
MCHQNRRDEPVTFPENSLHEARPLRIVMKHLTDFANGCVDPLLGIQEDVFAPESRNDFFPADELILVFHEKDQQFHGNFLEPQNSVAAAKFIALKIEFQFFGLDGSCGHCGCLYGWDILPHIISRHLRF